MNQSDASPSPPPPAHGRLFRALIGATASFALLVAVASAYGMVSVIRAGHTGTDGGKFGRSDGTTTQSQVDQAVGPCVEDVCNYLLLGSDSRAGLSAEQQRTFGSNGVAGAGLNSDVMMLVHTDPKLQKAIIVSFPRDLWVDIPGHGQGRINSAFGLGGGIDGDGPQLAARTIHALTGLKINHYLYVDLKGFEGVVQTLGGVDMCIPSENVNTPGWVSQETAHNGSHQVYVGEVGHIVDPNTGLDVVPGCQRLDPLEALAYVRSRHLRCDLIPDLYRIRRQQQFLQAVLNRVLQPSELVQTPRLVGPILSSMRRDSGLNLADLVHLVGEIKGINSGSVEFRTIPTTGFTTPAGQDVLNMDTSANEIFADILNGRPLGDAGLTDALTPPSPAQISVPVIDHGAGSKAQAVWSVLSDSGFSIAAAPTGAGGYPSSVSGNVIAYAPGHLVQAQVVSQYLPNVAIREVRNLPDDVAVFVTSSYTLTPLGSGTGSGGTSGCVA